MLILITSLIHLEKLLNKVRKKAFVIVTILMVQYSFAGILDSILYPPNLPSLSEAESLRTEFEEEYDNCYLPGTILYFKTDTTCFSPVQVQINNYNEYFQDSKDYEEPDIQMDSLYKIRYRLAMYAYKKFSKTKDKLRKDYDFSHSTFLQYLDEEEDIKEKSWLVKLVEKIYYFIEKYILKPFFKFIVAPVAKLSFFWKVILFILAIAVFLFVVVVVGRFAARFYPDVEFSKGKYSTVKGRNLPLNIDWLQRARENVNTASYSEATDCLYRYLISWSLDRSRIRRYEWWTNRQFLNIVRKRFKNDFNTADNIVYLYEQVIYGHTQPNKNDLESLVSRAGVLEGKKS